MAQDRLHAAVAVFIAVPAGMVKRFFVKLHTVIPERVHAALISLQRRVGQRAVAAKDGDLPMSAADQIIHRTGCAAAVVRGHAGEVFKRKHTCVVRDDNGRHMDLFKVVSEIAVRSAEEHDAHRLAFAAKLDRAQNLVLVLIDKIDDQRMRGPGKQRLQLLDHAREHFVCRTLDDDQNRIGALLLQKLRTFVQLKAALLRDGEDRRSRLL